MGWDGEGRLHMHGTRRDYLGTGLTGWRYYYLPDEAFFFFFWTALWHARECFLVYIYFISMIPALLLLEAQTQCFLFDDHDGVILYSVHVASH
jgi:hypothetical protein